MKNIKDKLRILLLLLVIDTMAYILTLPIVYISEDSITIEKTVGVFIFIVFYEILILFLLLPLLEYIFDNL